MGQSNKAAMAVAMAFVFGITVKYCHVNPDTTTTASDPSTIGFGSNPKKHIDPSQYQRRLEMHLAAAAHDSDNAVKAAQGLILPGPQYWANCYSKDMRDAGTDQEEIDRITRLNNSN